VSSNFDLGYNHGSVKVLDLTELENEIALDQAGKGCPGGNLCSAGYYSGAIVESSTVYIGSFGGKAMLTPGAQRLFVPQRQLDLVSFMDITNNGLTLSCKGAGKGGSASDWAGDCYKDHFLATGYFDPFGLSWGPNPAGTTAGCFYVSHLRAGVLSCIATGETGPVNLVPGYNPDFTLGSPVTGINDVAFDPNGRMYVANRDLIASTNFVGVGDPATMLPNPVTNWMIAIDYIAGVGEQKAVWIPPDGKTLYLQTNWPDAIIRFNITTDSSGNPSLVAYDYAPVGIGAMNMAQLEFQTPPRRFLYVPCTNWGYVHVIDGYTMEEIALLDDPSLIGPYAIAFYDAPAGKRVIVGNFESGQLSVYSVDPVTLVHTQIAVVGAPRNTSGGY
jgi:hypothetical protein